jgi:hypothetical protein
MLPVVDIHDFENLIAQKMGYEDTDAFHKSLRKEEYESYSTLDKVRDHIGWSIVDIYGNGTFYDMDVLDNFRADWTARDDAYCYNLTEEEAELFNKIDRIVIKLVEDGEIPDEFVLHVWW